MFHFFPGDGADEHEAGHSEDEKPIQHLHLGDIHLASEQNQVGAMERLIDQLDSLADDFRPNP